MKYRFVFVHQNYVLFKKRWKNKMHLYHHSVLLQLGPGTFLHRGYYVLVMSIIQRSVALRHQ